MIISPRIVILGSFALILIRSSLNLSFEVDFFGKKWHKKEFEMCQKLRNDSTLHRSLVLPYRSSFEFLCFACLSRTEMTLKKSPTVWNLWKFVPFIEAKVYPISPIDSNIRIDQNGHLRMHKIQSNGTYYCIYRMRILAIYSITVLRKPPIHRLLEKGSSHLRSSINNFTSTFNGAESLRIDYERLYRIPCNDKRRFSTQISVHICYLHGAHRNSTSPSASNELFLRKINAFKKLSCFEPLINRIVLEQFFLPGIIEHIQICSNRLIKSSKKKQNRWKNLIESARKSINIKISPGQSITICCGNYNGWDNYVPREIRMIEFNLLDEKNLGRNLLNQSVRLSRLFLSKASQNRMEFDFLGNVHIDPVEVFDFDLTFQCYDGEKRVTSIRLLPERIEFYSSFESFSYIVRNFRIFVLIIAAYLLLTNLILNKDLDSKIY
ncbi:hypothetical protein NH340_JMT04316 [Sarcoptes scabiei]|nr:hypothetical protein NH340_JMT04316 [Sarcoptes scabiei]